MLDPQRRFVTLGVRGWLIAVAIFAGAFLLWAILAGALSAFLLLFTGVLFAAGLRPLVNRLRARMPFGTAVAIAFGATILIAVLVAYLLIAPLGTEVERLVKATPGYLTALQDRFVAAQRFAKSSELVHQLGSALAGSAGAAINAIAPQLLRGPVLVATVVGNGLIIVLLAFGWMLSSDELSVFVLSLLPPAARKDWQQTFDMIGTRLSAYVQGVVLNGIVVGIAMGIALGILNVPYALLLAFIVALLQAIPMVGAVISGIILLLAVLAISGWTKMLIVLAVFAVVQIIDQNMLSPIIFGKRVQLSFLLIIFSTIVGGTLLGIAGAFLAVPAAAVLQVVVVQIVAPAIRRANQTGD
jgi:predicted PurR-regulated permease PerM